MAVYPKGDKFMASFGAGATRVRKTFNTEAEGVAWEQAQEAARGAEKALPGHAVIAPTCWTLKQALTHTLRHKWKDTPGEAKTLINAEQALVFFGPDTPTSEITAGRILEWMEELQDSGGNSGSTCNKKLSALNVMLKQAEEFGGLPAVPRTKRYKEAKHRIRWFSDVEEKVMLDMSAHLGLDELHDAIIIGIDTGFRRSEFLRLDSRDYSKGNLMAHAGETKNGDARAVPCTDRVVEVLERRFKAGHRVFPTLTDRLLTTQWDNMRALLGRADDPGFIVHVMRHTCATRLVAEGTPLNEVQAWMGHKVIATTMRYAHLMPGALLGAAGRLNARKPQLETV